MSLVNTDDSQDYVLINNMYGINEENMDGGDLNGEIADKYVSNFTSLREVKDERNVRERETPGSNGHAIWYSRLSQKRLGSIGTFDLLALFYSTHLTVIKIIKKYYVDPLCPHHSPFGSYQIFSFVQI